MNLQIREFLSFSLSLVQSLKAACVHTTRPQKIRDVLNV